MCCSTCLTHQGFPPHKVFIHRKRSQQNYLHLLDPGEQDPSPLFQPTCVFQVPWGRKLYTLISLCFFFPPPPSLGPEGLRPARRTLNMCVSNLFPCQALQGGLFPVFPRCSAATSGATFVRPSLGIAFRSSSF